MPFDGLVADQTMGAPPATPAAAAAAEPHSTSRHQHGSGHALGQASLLAGYGTFRCLYTRCHYFDAMPGQKGKRQHAALDTF